MERIGEKYKNDMVVNLIISSIPHTYIANMEEGEHEGVYMAKQWRQYVE